jgi:hypothetical protein
MAGRRVPLTEAQVLSIEDAAGARLPDEARRCLLELSPPPAPAKWPQGDLVIAEFWESPDIQSRFEDMELDELRMVPLGDDFLGNVVMLDAAKDEVFLFCWTNPLRDEHVERLNVTLAEFFRGVVSESEATQRRT